MSLSKLTPDTDELIKWYWEAFYSFLPNGSNEDGICQCGTENLIKHSDNPNKMRTFLMIASFIDQMMYTHFHEVYLRFRARYRFPKLYSHATIVGMANPGWLVYSYHGYDKMMDWKAARPIAIQLLTECLKFITSETNDKKFYKVWCCYCW